MAENTDQENRMLYLKSVLVSRFQGSIIPEPDQQTPLVLAGIQEE